MDESIITSNELILKRILHFMAFEGLMTCGLVNKRWNSLSRTVLYRERKCLAKIGKDNPCQQLLSLNDLLKDTERLPFNGLSMSYSYHFIDNCLQDTGILRTTYSAVFDFLPIKYLNIVLDQYSDCLALQFIKLLVRERGAEIQEISVSTTDFEFCSLPTFFGISEANKDWLPNVTSIELRTEQVEHVLHEMAAAAPKLQAIRGYVRPDHLPALLSMKKANLISEFHLNISNEHLGTCFEFAKLKPKLQKLSISSQDIRESNAKRMSELVLSILPSSYATLHTLDVEHLDLIMLVPATDVVPFENLRNFSIHYNLGLDRHLGFFSISRINFQESFPNLKSCKIYTSRYAYSPRDMNLIPAAFKHSDSFYRAHSVTELKIQGTPFKPVSMSARIPLAAVFPSVKKIGINSCTDTYSYLEYILNAWPDLESIQFSADEYPRNLTNLDKLFCGISEEECSYLRSLERKDAGFLQNFEIVPSRPCLLHLRGLKTLKIKVKHNDRCPPVKPSSPSDFLSDVCGQLVFARMPNLKVEIRRALCRDPENTSCCFYFDDLQRFAKITTIEGVHFLYIADQDRNAE